jgi:hypothetical protein
MRIVSLLKNMISDITLHHDVHLSLIGGIRRAYKEVGREKEQPYVPTEESP